MGTFFELQLVHQCAQPVSDEFILTIQNELNQMESEMSLYQKESPISQLNREGRLLTGQFKHLKKVLSDALQASKNTEFAFNPTIYPVLSLIKNSFEKRKKSPSDQELKSLRSLLEPQNIKMNEKEIIFMRSGMAITLDGIAKGYAVDQVAVVLERRGIKNYLLNFSGNMRWLGKKHNQQFWKISRWNPLTRTAHSLPESSSGAIASSGVEYSYYSEDKTWHHIIDPKTLKPARYWSSVTVVGAEAEVCDLLSTAAFVLPLDQIKKILKKNYPSYRIHAVDLKNHLFDSL